MVFIVDWEEGADYFYPRSAANTRVVGAKIAKKIEELKALGFSSSQFWCVGFSLGARTCGFAGKATHIARVTGEGTTVT